MTNIVTDDTGSNVMDDHRIRNVHVSTFCCSRKNQVLGARHLRNNINFSVVNRKRVKITFFWGGGGELF